MASLDFQRLLKQEKARHRAELISEHKDTAGQSRGRDSSSEVKCQIEGAEATISEVTSKVVERDFTQGSPLSCFSELICRPKLDMVKVSCIWLLSSVSEKLWQVP